MTAPPTRPGLNRLLFRVAVTQLHLASVGIYVRAGIDFGRHHESQNLLFSEGLLNAYSIENKRAIYPRVVLSNNVIEFIEAHKSRRFIYGLLLADSDEEWFVDYLWLLSLDEYPGDRFEALRNHGREIREAKIAHGGDPRILQKMAWLQRYHDHWVGILRADNALAIGDNSSGFSPLKKWVGGV